MTDPLAFLFVLRDILPFGPTHFLLADIGMHIRIHGKIQGGLLRRDLSNVHPPYTGQKLFNAQLSQLLYLAPAFT